MSDLDETVLDGFNQRWLPTNVETALQKFLLKLVLPPDTPTVPAGVPIAWIINLPISPTIRDAVSEIWVSQGQPEFFAECITSAEISSVKGIQPFHITELLCVLESVEYSHPLGLSESSYLAPLSVGDDLFSFWTSAATEIQKSAAAPVEYGKELIRFCTWALCETDTVTVGDAIGLVAASDSCNSTWDAFTNIRLNEVAPSPLHPYSILEIWAQNLGEREKEIFDLRVAINGRPRTLQELGESMGITRERVRQLESRIQAKLVRFLTTDDAEPIRWRADTIRKKVGAAAPLRRVRALLSPNPGDPDYRSVLLGLAGPYVIENGWVIKQSKVASDPLAQIISSADEVGRIPTISATSELYRWGLLPEFHRGWLLRTGEIRELGGKWYRWNGSIADKLVAALDDIGTPTPIDTLLAHGGIDRARGSALNALSADARAVRVNRTDWGLGLWGHQRFSSIAEAIRGHLEQAGGPVRLRELIDQLSRDFSLRESSIRAYCEAPMFVLEDGYVRLRREDESYSIPGTPIRGAKGVFYLGPQRVSRLLEVNKDLLRGSGQALTFAAGAVLNVVPDRILTFYDDDGIQVNVTFPSTSTMGPSLGSVKALAEKHDANLGDYLTVVLDASDMSIIANSTSVDDYQPGWDLVSRLVGIQRGDGVPNLHTALGCSPGEEREVLVRRGDEIVKNALPALDDSPGLDEALAALQTEFQRTGKLPA